jgi:hypothetical protein
MALLPSIPAVGEQSQPVAAREGEVRRASEHASSHEKRFRASLAWALDEYASTLAKLAR